MEISLSSSKLIISVNLCIGRTEDSHAADFESSNEVLTAGTSSMSLSSSGTQNVLRDEVGREGFSE